MRISLTLFFLSICLITIGQVSDTTHLSGEYYVITEAYFITPDTSYNLQEYFVDKTSGILLMPVGDSTVIAIDQGNIDSVVYLGYAIRTSNLGFKTTRDDSEFYKWSYIEPNNPHNKEAVVMKEYITDSLEKRGKRFYFFHIVNVDLTELQFYAYLLRKVGKM